MFTFNPLVFTVSFIVTLLIMYCIRKKPWKRKVKTEADKAESEAKADIKVSKEKPAPKESDRIYAEYLKQDKLCTTLTNEWASLYCDRHSATTPEEKYKSKKQTQEANIRSSSAQLTRDDLYEDYLRVLEREKLGLPITEPTELDIIEKEYREQKKACSASLTKWSDLYDIVERGNGTLREITEAELIIGAASKQKEDDKKKLESIKAKFKAALAREKAAGHDN